MYVCGCELGARLRWGVCNDKMAVECTTAASTYRNKGKLSASWFYMHTLLFSDCSCFNGSQLAKMNKYIPHMSMPRNL